MTPISRMSGSNPATGPIKARISPKSTDNALPTITAHSSLVSLGSLMAIAILVIPVTMARAAIR